MNDKERFYNGEKVTWRGIAANVALTVFKVLAGIIGQSTAMIADATHSASDVVATCAVLAGLKVAKKPLDKEHPYGHGKIEPIVAAFIGLLLIGAGMVILYSAVRSVLTSGISPPETVALVAAAISILIKEAMFRHTIKVGKEINSPAIIANAWDHRSDAISSVAAFVGIGGAMLGYPILDPVAGGVVSLFVVKMGAGVAVDAYHHLMDHGPSEEIMERIIFLAEQVRGVEHAYSRARKMGQFYHVDVKIEISPEVSVAEGHNISRIVKRKILKGIDHVADVMVHIHPHDEEG